MEGDSKNGIIKLLAFLKTPTDIASTQTQGPNIHAMAMAIVETDQHLKEERIDPKADQLKFWMDSRSKFPHLHELAISYIYMCSSNK